MNEWPQIRRWIIGVVFLANCSLLFNCQPIKKLLVKPSPEGLMETAYTVRLRGYMQTVTVKADPAAVRAYISNPANVRVPGLKFEQAERSWAESPLPTIGQWSPFVIRAFGLEIKGRVMVVRSDEEKLWLLLESPFGFHIQRWQFKPVKDGIQLTFQMEYELQEKGIKGQLGKITELVGLGEALEKGMDRMLAEVQVHFDPSLEADQLVALGVRGESYETFLQTYEKKIHVEAEPERIEAWVLDPQNSPLLIEEFRVEEIYFLQMQQLPSGNLLYAPALFEVAGLKADADLFAHWQSASGNTSLQLYMLAFGIIGLLDLEAEPERGGSLLTMKMVFEIPTALSAERLDLLLLLAGIPRRLQERMFLIKNGVEQVG
jgi:hypothetical protein